MQICGVIGLYVPGGGIKLMHSYEDKSKTRLPHTQVPAVPTSVVFFFRGDISFVSKSEMHRRSSGFAHSVTLKK